MTMARERLGSRLGFILISAGCAIGLGNVWRFPYIVGQYGGAAFVLMYLVFLVAFSLPIMVVEFSIGRASQKSMAGAFEALEPPASKWHRIKWIGLAGPVLLMMYYTTVSGWMLAYIFKSASGEFEGLSSQAVGGVYDGLLADPAALVFWMVVVVAVGLAVCLFGLQGGVERVGKFMMSSLLVVLVALAVRSITLEGAAEGLEFYLMPDFGKLLSNGPGGFLEAMFAAMGQAFFTLSVGMGSMEIFGSYIGKERSLAGEALRIAALDTAVAFTAGLVIFPASFAFGVQPGSGPGLVFVTLPTVFNQMPLGQLWGTLFFVFMSFAALTTVVAVFEGIISFVREQWRFGRKRATALVAAGIAVLSVPCALGFNVFADAQVPGIGNIQAVEDFIVSSNLMPIGAICMLMFCVSKRGWGAHRFLEEADTGRGLMFPRWAVPYMRYVLPVLVLAVLTSGWVPIIAVWMAV